MSLAGLALRFVERRMWRQLGFRSLLAYVEAQPNLCLSTLEHQATLGRHLRRHPSLAKALQSGRIGTEAALLVGRVLGRWSETTHAVAWIERARARTYRCLREEISLVLITLSFDPRASRFPPGLEDLEEAAAVERRVQSGELFRSLLGARNLDRDAAGPAYRVRAANLATALGRALRALANDRRGVSRARGCSKLVHRVHVPQSLEHVAAVPGSLG